MQTERPQSVVEFFDTELRWWEDVYNESLPKGFLSFEMIKRKELFMEKLLKYASGLEGGRILDCGCGPGDIINSIGMKSRIYGIDINNRYLLKAKSKNNNDAEFLNCDLENLPFSNETFDLSYCIGVLSYLKRDDRAIREIARVTKTGGVVIIALPNVFRLGQIVDPTYAFHGAYKHLVKKKNTNKNSTKIRRYATWKLDPLYKANYLNPLEVTGTSYGPMTFMSKKPFDLSRNIRISEGLRSLSSFRGFKFLNHLSNHWIACLQKT